MNLEALAAPIVKPVEILEIKPEIIEPEALVEAVEAVAIAVEPERVEQLAEEVMATITPVVPDDLTRLVGIGPKIAEALAARGVATFANLAALTADDLTAIDTEMNLKGRPVRDAWVAQAQRLAANA